MYIYIYIYTYDISYDGDDMFVLSGLVDPADSPSSSKFRRICFLEVSISMIVWVVILRHLQFHLTLQKATFSLQHGTLIIGISWLLGELGTQQPH